ncbi:MAG: glycosyltransferase family 39 protein [Candidatus Rokubacteria bacterium]|nr:glycosyltransferase family 39 protein [Candidatus Rokubacteria bacterium]
MADSSGLISGLLFLTVLAGAGSLAIATTRQHHATIRFQIALFLVALAVRFGTAIAIYGFGLVDLIRDADATIWTSGLNTAKYWARYGVGLFDLPSVMLEAYSDDNRGYVYLLGAVYLLWDYETPSRYVAAALNCGFGALTAVLVYRAARSLFGSDVAARVGWWMCFFPSLVIWSAQTLKEPVVIFLETVTLYSALQLVRGGSRWRYLVASVAAVVLIMPFRFYVSYLVGGVTALALAVGMLRSNRIPLRPLIAGLAVIGGGVAVAIIAAQNETVQGLDIDYVFTQRENFARGYGSGVSLSYDIGTIPGLVLGTVVGALYLLFAPFPWDWVGGSSLLLLTVPEVVMWWGVFFYGVVPGLRYALKTRFGDIAPILALVVGFGLLYSLVFGNIGLVYRQRAQLVPWLLIFAVVGFDERRRRREAGEGGRLQAGRRVPVPS